MHSHGINLDRLKGNLYTVWNEKESRFRYDGDIIVKNTVIDGMAIAIAEWTL